MPSTKPIFISCVKQLTFSLLCALFATSVLLASPASITELTINSNEQRLPGLIYQAAGDGPHPTAIFLHGYPGNERSLDVAQRLRQLGWNTVYFNYRGAWGAEGEFSFLNSEADVQAVIEHLSLKENAQQLRIDPTRISLIGHSMGGHMAIAGILDNPKVRCAIAYDGANMGIRSQGLFENPQSAELWKSYSDTLFMLNGWSGDKAIKEIREHGGQLDLIARADQLGDRAVLLIPADTDVIPMEVHIRPLFEALSKNKGAIVNWQLLDDDHSFSNSREQLIAHTYTFLNSHCSQPSTPASQ